MAKMSDAKRNALVGILENSKQWSGDCLELMGKEAARELRRLWDFERRVLNVSADLDEIVTEGNGS